MTGRMSTSPEGQPGMLHGRVGRDPHASDLTVAADQARYDQQSAKRTALLAVASQCHLPDWIEAVRRSWMNRTSICGCPALASPRRSRDTIVTGGVVMLGSDQPRCP